MGRPWSWSMGGIPPGPTGAGELPPGRGAPATALPPPVEDGGRLCDELPPADGVPAGRADPAPGSVGLGIPPIVGFAAPGIGGLGIADPDGGGFIRDIRLTLANSVARSIENQQTDYFFIAAIRARFAAIAA